MPILQNDIDPTWQDGVNITDTFDVWRKKTNGHIAGYKSIITNADIADLTIQSIKLAPPAPSWDQTTGTVTTNGTVGGFIVKGGFTSGLSSSINVASTASAAPALSITSSSRILRFNPNSTIGSFNPLVAAGDYSIIAGSSNSDTQNIIIGKWSNSQHGVVIGQGRVGINRVATTNAFEVQGAISATGEIIGGSLNTGTGTISTAGAIYCGSLGAGSGTISTTGQINGGTIIGSSLSAGSGTISTTGAITGGVISTSQSTATNGIPVNSGINLNAQGNGYIYGTNQDGASNTLSNVKISSSFGIGFGPSIASQTIPQGENAVYINCRNGDLTARGNVIAYSTSDRKFKDNIKNIIDPLSKVSQINGVTFDWNDKQTTFTGSDIGVIAQEVELVLPEIVTTREDGSKAVKYEKMVALLIECVKELKSEIDGLKLLIK